MLKVVIVEDGDGKKGVVVPGLPGLTGPGCVMVDFDGGGESARSEKDLVKVGMFDVQFDEFKCGRCVFSASGDCHRYRDSRIGWLFSRRPNRKLPKKMYPSCQEEMSVSRG